MINELTIRRFKSIEEASIELRHLNLLIGANSAGKSSAIQALLLGIDNACTGEEERYCEMRQIRPSSFNEMRNYVLNAKDFEIELDGEQLVFRSADDDLKKTLVKNASGLKIGKQSVYYLPAIRLSDLGHSVMNQSTEQNPLGYNGEYVIDHFYNHRQDILPEGLVENNVVATLEGHVNHWLKRLTGYTVQVMDKGSEYEVQFCDCRSKMLRPNHVGTGISFMLELLIVCLSAKEGDVVIVENPEIHLHPSAQAEVMDFMAKITKSGKIQIIVESHSDHLFNGIRRLLHEEKLQLNDVAVHNFTLSDGLTTAKEVKFSQQGGIRDYIPGMFDQFDKDLDAILK